MSIEYVASCIRFATKSADIRSITRICSSNLISYGFGGRRAWHISMPKDVKVFGLTRSLVSIEMFSLDEGTGAKSTFPHTGCSGRSGVSGQRR